MADATLPGPLSPLSPQGPRRRRPANPAFHRGSPANFSTTCAALPTAAAALRTSIQSSESNTNNNNNITIFNQTLFHVHHPPTQDLGQHQHNHAAVRRPSSSSSSSSWLRRLLISSLRFILRRLCACSCACTSLCLVLLAFMSALVLASSGLALKQAQYVFLPHGWLNDPSPHSNLFANQGQQGQGQAGHENDFLDVSFIDVPTGAASVVSPRIILLPSVDTIQHRFPVLERAQDLPNLAVGYQELFSELLDARQRRHPHGMQLQDAYGLPNPSHLSEVSADVDNIHHRAIDLYQATRQAQQEEREDSQGGQDDDQEESKQSEDRIEDNRIMHRGHHNPPVRGPAARMLSLTRGQLRRDLDVAALSLARHCQPVVVVSEKGQQGGPREADMMGSGSCRGQSEEKLLDSLLGLTRGAASMLCVELGDEVQALEQVLWLVEQTSI